MVIKDKNNQSINKMFLNYIFYVLKKNNKKNNPISLSNITLFDNLKHF